MERRQPCVYMMASRRNGTLYIGVTSDPITRIWQHKNNVADSFSRCHRVHTLVWYELHETMESAILREKRLKSWHRVWKARLIEGENPEWVDLYSTLMPLGSGLRRNDE